MNIAFNENDEVVIKLIHYFITKQGYNPVLLHGIKDEIWLENTKGDYKIVRIVLNYIHNDEQLDMDLFRTKQILRKIKHKMFSFKMSSLNIFVNLGDNVDVDKKNNNNFDCINVKSFDDIGKYENVINTFPNILEVENVDKKGFELFIKLTQDINEKNLEESKKAEDVFAKRTPIVTYILMAINIIMFLFLVLKGGNIWELDANLLEKYGALVSPEYLIKPIDYLKIITSIFLHGGIIHLLFNMYALYVIGPQLESFFGKIKYLFIYLIGGICGNLLSLLLLNGNYVSVGASGAIFGLFGALLYFGYHYRVYLSGVVKSQIIPLIVANLVIGFFIAGINNMAHIGGLIGGFLVAKAVGVKYRSEKSDMINGVIMTLIFIGFLIYMNFFR